MVKLLWQETEGRATFYLNQTSYCWARWKIARCRIRKESFLLNYQSPIACAVPDSQGCILPTYAKMVVGRVQWQPLLSRTKQLFLLASHCRGLETSPACQDGSSSSFLDVLLAVKSLQATRESFGVNLCLRWSSLGISLLLFISILYFLLFFFLSAFTAFPSVFLSYGSFNLYIIIFLGISWQLWHFSQQKSVKQ